MGLPTALALFSCIRCNSRAQVTKRRQPHLQKKRILLTVSHWNICYCSILEQSELKRNTFVHAVYGGMTEYLLKLCLLHRKKIGIQLSNERSIYWQIPAGSFRQREE